MKGGVGKMKKKKISLRKCISCLEMKPKKELLRIVKNKQNEIKVDCTGRANGRGAYICLDIDCLAIAKRKKKLEKVFGSSIDEKIYDTIEEELKTKK